MKEIDELINQLEANIEFENQSDLTISKVAVGWHIDHSLKVLNGVVTVLKNSNPEEYQKKFNLMKKLIFLLGFIPRGKAKAPKIVRPEGEINRDTLASSVSKVRENLIGWKDFDKNANFPHPFFGVLNKKETENFLVLHTKHHLMIVNDILKSN